MAGPLCYSRQVQRLQKCCRGQFLHPELVQSSQAERRDHEPGVHAEDRQQEGDRAEPRLPEPPRVHLQPAQGVQIRDNGGKQEEIRRTGPESLIKIKNLLNANDTLILYKYNIVKLRQGSGKDRQGMAL